MIDEPIPTPSGWTNLGNLKVGDRVFGPDGSPCMVIARTSVFKNADCYRIIFNNGSNCICSGDHQWPIERHTRKRIPMAYNNPGPKRLYRETVIMTTREIAAHDHRQDKRLAIRLAQALALPKADLSIDPYVLGCWLGDGNSACATISCGDKDKVHFVEQFQSAGFPVQERRDKTAWRLIVGARYRSRFCVRGHDRTKVGTYRNQCNECRRQRQAHSNGGPVPDPVIADSFSWRLRRLGVLADPAGKRRGCEKHVPAEYLRASTEQRLAILQGLMDTDGHCSTRGSATFVNKSDRLARDVYDLAVTLGMRPNIRQHHTSLPDGRLYQFWHVSFQAYSEKPPFRLERKIARCIKRMRPKRVFIVSTEKVSSVPVSFIQVDREDGMYLTGRSMFPTRSLSIINAAASAVMNEVTQGKNQQAD